MKIKILVIAIIFLMTSSIFTMAHSETKKCSIEKDIIAINIALFADEKLGWGSGRHLFNYLLDEYQWNVGNKTYKFKITEIFDEDILKGKLTVNNYDIFLCPGGGIGDANSAVRGITSFTSKTKKWKEAINDFVENGGGYCGFCGGSAIATKFYKDPGHIAGRVYDQGSLDFTDIKMYMGDGKFGFDNLGPALYLSANVIVSNLKDPDNILKWKNVNSGICLDMQIKHDNPIFDDYLDDKCRVRWVGGPAFVVPDDYTRELSILAEYPEWEISENISTRLHEWKYIGGIFGPIKGFIKAWKVCKEYGKPLPPSPYATAICTPDWEKTDELIEFNYSNKPGILSEVYPNDKEGRIVLNGLHPEYPMWFGGHIVESEDTNDNNWLDGLFKWEDRVPWEETPEDEFTYTWWIVRRSVAWAAKIPDDDLPPVYGPSQVCDFETAVDFETFTVNGNSETADGIISLDLYYRYSDDNVNWSNWILFDTDYDEADGWNWQFNSPNGTGYYEFYSIRNVEYEGYVETEKVPPAADSKVFVEID